MEVMSNESLPDFVGRMAEEHWRARLQVAELEAIAGAARAVVAEPSLLWPYEEDGRVLALVNALDALGKEETDGPGTD